MSILQTVSLRAKFLIMLFIPLTALIFFGTRQVLEQQVISQRMATLDQLSNLGVRIGDLVHEIQKERGRSAGYLGSNGTDFKQELAKQRTLTDHQIELLQTFLGGFDTDGANNALSASIDEGRHHLEMISHFRVKVDALQVSGAEAVNFYSDMIRSLLQPLDLMPRLSTDPSVTVMIFSYVNFLRGKEMAGIERAVLSNTFAHNAFAPGMFQRFVALMAQQEAYFHVFTASADQSQVTFWKQSVTEQVVGEVEKLRNIALAKAAEGNFGVDPGAWFKASTARIEQFKQVEDRISLDLRNHAGTLRVHANHIFWTVLLSTSVVVGFRTIAW